MGVGVAVAVFVGVGVAVAVFVGVGVRVGVAVGTGEGVGEGDGVKAGVRIGRVASERAGFPARLILVEATAFVTGIDVFEFTTWRPPQADKLRSPDINRIHLSMCIVPIAHTNCSMN